MLCSNLWEFGESKNLDEIIRKTTNDVAEIKATVKGNVVGQVPDRRYDSGRKMLRFCPAGNSFAF